LYPIMANSKKGWADKVRSVVRSVSAKKTYKAPHLIVYGNVARLTASVHHSNPSDTRRNS
jgi:hypothetical protein